MLQKKIINFYSQTPPAVLFVGLVVAVTPLLPIPGLTGTGYHDGQRILLVICVCVGVVTMSLRMWRAKSDSSKLMPVLPVSRLVLWLLIIFMGLGFLSSLRAYSVQFALYEWSTTALLVVLASTIAAEVAQNRVAALKSLAALGAIGCSLYVFNALVAYVSMLLLGIQAHPNDLIVGFDNYRFFNHVQTVSLPLLALLALRSGSIGSNLYRYRYGLRILIVSWWMLLFVTGGRGTLVGLLAGSSAALFFFRRDAMTWCRHMLIGAMVGLAASWVLYTCVPILFGLQPFGLLGNVAARTVEDVDSGRMSLWRLATEMTMAQPWLGAGPLHFAHVGRFLQVAAHPHNWVLQIASEWGIPALLCFSGLIFVGLRRLTMTVPPPDANRPDRLTVLAALLATGIAIVVDGLVSGLIVMPASQLWIALYVGGAWGWTERFKRSLAVSPASLSCLTRGCVTAFLVMLIALGAYGLWPAGLNLPKHEKGNERYQANHTDGHLSPRVWRHGFF